MTVPDAVWTIDCTLKAKGFEYVGPPATYRGPIAVHGLRVVVEAEFSDLDFATLPCVRLVDGSALGGRAVAHVLDDGGICYTDEGGLVLDLYDPGGSALRVLEEAGKALERSFGGGVEAEFEAELAAYWGGGHLYSLLDVRAGPSILRAEVVSSGDARPEGLLLVAEGAMAHLTDRFPATVIVFDVPLRRGLGFRPADLGQALAFVDGQRSPPPGWRNAVLGATTRLEGVYLVAPNAVLGWRPTLTGSLALVQANPKGFRKGYLRSALPAKTKEVEVKPLVAKEADLRFCVSRNLEGGPSLVDKRVAVVGCGTIGGYLAHFLVQNGAGCGGELALFDPDVLKPGNLGRHLLGFPDLGKGKAEALARFLLGFHPDVRVDHWNASALDERSDVAEFDLIIDATGDANVATAVNERILAVARGGNGRAPALLHSWVFGNGVAGQSFLNLADGLACYRCLRVGFGGPWRHDPRRDREAPVRRAAARCGEGGYVPFPSDASVAAATLAVRAAVDWATGSPGYRLRTTIVDHVAGRDRMPWVSPTRLEDCPACG